MFSLSYLLLSCIPGWIHSNILIRSMDKTLWKKLYFHFCFQFKIRKWEVVIQMCYTKSKVFFSLTYINDLATNLKSTVKLLANNTSLFSVVSDLLDTTNILNQDFEKIRSWAEKRKMAFDPDPTKRAQEIVFSKYLKRFSSLPLFR